MTKVKNMSLSQSDYALIEAGREDQWSIMIREGEYEGVVYSYDKIGISEDGVLSYHFTVEEPCDFNADVLQYDDAFKNRIGDILVHILEDSLQSGSLINK